ncbi:MAG: T9SS type A sorting domain-containing protein [Bacteroidetes bacterium]|nr:T9SS type A sorting domain-containing protein [Bacteroidota bacterium]
MNGPNQGNDIGNLSSGSVVSVGKFYRNGIWNHDVTIIKYSTDGSLLNEYYLDFYNDSLRDEGVKIKVLNDFIYVLVAAQYYTTPGVTEGNIGVIKLDSNLNLVNQFSFNSDPGIEEMPIDMGLDQSGNVYVIGWAERPATGRDFVFIKLDQNLNFIFSKYNSSPGNYSDEPSEIAVEANGVCNIVGTKNSLAKGSQISVLKYWGNGVLLWQKTYDIKTNQALDDLGHYVTFDPSNGDVFVAGVGQTSLGGYNEWIVLRYDAIDGSRKWIKRMTASNKSFYPRGLEYYNLGALYICGAIGSIASNNVDLQVRKLDPSNGNVLWNRTFDGIATGIEDNDRLSSMLVSPSEEIFLMGSTDDGYFNGSNVFHLVLKYNSSGNLIWSSKLHAGFPIHAGWTAEHATYHAGSQSLYVSGTRYASPSIIWTTTKYSTALPVVDETYSNRSLQASTNYSKKGELNIYPNPADQFFYLRLDEEREGQLVITDLSGKIVYQRSNVVMPFEVISGDWSSGVYFVTFNCGDRIYKEKVIKN